MTKLIRPWTIQDLSAVREITWSTWLDAYRWFIPEPDLKSYFEEHYSLEALITLLHQKDADGFVAEVNDHLAAYEKNMFSEEERRYYVSSLYVISRYQGLGLGTDLLASAEQKAREHGLDRIWLGVMSDNKPTLAWYRRKGFIFVQELPFKMGGTTVQHLIGYRIF